MSSEDRITVRKNLQITSATKSANCDRRTAANGTNGKTANAAVSQKFNQVF
jgi:hypothetical protein